MTLKSDLPPFLRLLAFMLAIACTTSCGVGGTTNSAETQASLPISETENSAGVSFSSPNSLGLVTVTGNDAVPSGATVVVDVNTATSFLRDGFRRVANFVIPSANAATCESALPTCPDVDVDEKCQYTADTEGDFSLQIPADLGDSISVSYLDSTSCQEVDVVDESTVDSDTPVLGLIATGADFDNVNSILYVLGYDVQDDFTMTTTITSISSLDNSLLSATPTDSEIATSSPEHLAIFSDDGENKYLAVDFDDGTAVGLLTDPATGSLDDISWIFIENNSSTLPLSFLTAARFSTASDSVPCTAIPDQTADTFTRLFFTDGQSLFYVEFAGLISNADSAYFRDGSSTAATTFEAIQIPLLFQDGVSDPRSPNDVNYLNFKSDLTYLSANFGESSSVQDYYFFRLPRLTQSDVCSGTGITLNDVDSLSLGSHTFSDLDITLPQFDTISEQESIATGGETSNFFTAFFPDDQTIYYVETDAQGDCCYRREMAYDSATQILSANTYGAISESLDEATENTLTTLGAGQIKRAISVVPEASGQNGMFFVGDLYEGSAFFDGRENSLNAGLEPEDPLYALFPRAGFYDISNNQIIVLDLQVGSDSIEFIESGTASSGTNISTFVRFYQLNDL